MFNYFSPTATRCTPPSSSDRVLCSSSRKDSAGKGGWNHGSPVSGRPNRWVRCGCHHSEMLTSVHCDEGHGSEGRRAPFSAPFPSFCTRRPVRTWAPPACFYLYVVAATAAVADVVIIFPNPAAARSVARSAIVMMRRHWYEFAHASCAPCLVPLVLAATPPPSYHPLNLSSGPNLPP